MHKSHFQTSFFFVFGVKKCVAGCLSYCRCRFQLLSPPHFLLALLLAPPGPLLLASILAGALLPLSTFHRARMVSQMDVFCSNLFVDVIALCQATLKENSSVVHAALRSVDRALELGLIFCWCLVYLFFFKLLVLLPSRLVLLRS